MNETTDMARGAATPGIVLPKLAPIVAVKTPHEAAWDTACPNSVIPTRIVLDKRCTLTTFRVLTVLASHADRSGLTRVGQNRLAALLDCSQQLVSRHLKILQECGIIKVAYRQPLANGHTMNVYRIVLDPAVTAADARSISQPHTAPRHTHNTQAVVGGSQHSGVVSPTLTTPQRNTPTTRINGSHSLQPDSGMNCELIKPLHNKLKTADAVIEHWLAYAWKHAKERPIANDDDLATAHKIAAMGITPDQLEYAIIDDPEAPRLARAARRLLS